MDLFSPSRRNPTERAAAVFFAPWSFRRRSLYYYALGKMRLDPAYPLLARMLSESGRAVIDVGCGAGVFAAYLREQGVRALLWGVDVSAEKIALARTCVAGVYADLDFVAADAAQWAGPEVGQPVGEVVALDVLHYFSDAARRRLLEKMLGWLPPGGRVFLRNGVRDVCGWRHSCTQMEEWWVRRSRWICGGAWNFPARSVVEQELREAGAAAVVSLPLWGRTPFSSYLFVATRR